MVTQRAVWVVGSSNSRSRPTGGTGFEVRGAGIDTWSPCWYVGEGPVREALTNAFSARSQRGVLLPGKVMGHRVGYVGAHGLLWAEGHPGAALGREGLLCPDELVAAYRALFDGLWSEGVPVPSGHAGDDAFGDELHQGAAGTFRRGGFAGIRRCDATVDVRFGSEAEGEAVLAGVLALFQAMRGQAGARWAKGSLGHGVETAYLFGHGGKRVLGRWYDKGIQTGEQVRGGWIRGEDQRRWDKTSRRDVGELSGRYVRTKWQSRFLPLWKASKGVTVAGPVVLLRKLEAAVDAGDVARSQAQCVALAIMEDMAGVALGSRSARYRWRASARELGLVLGSDVLQDVEVDLHAVIEAALETDAWERRG